MGGGGGGGGKKDGQKKNYEYKIYTVLSKRL